ncbi:MAG TPA: undecaprenyl/decaprenyl-phosphate alpha-N-acetylglucosaminyl 1-phosphate transferase [Anaerolineae bacterium]|nr:undecaprenyl/decaprenyl-phosphate alpha-N-acetylglucosaminyl 1-phosphate transferase [Anaerolineae bacterium]
MTTYLLIFAAALVLAVGATPLARRIAVRLGITDQPSARKIHVNPIPLLGGVAIYGAFTVALLLFGGRYRLHELFGILVGASLVSFLGLWDDRRGLSPLFKLIGQFAAASILVLTGVRIGTFPWEWLNVIVTLGWVVVVTNALNLLDNMDGLSGGVGAVAATFFLLLAAMNDQYLVGALSAALVGACLGFLRYNFNPASIFMGDAGSLFLGFMLAAVGIKLRFPDNVEIVTWMVPVLILGLPLFDTTLVIISRLRRDLNPLTTPGKDHVSHRLAAMGYTRREAVLILYLVCAALGVLALFVTQASIVEGYVVGGVTAAAALWSLWRLEQVDFPGKEVRGDFLAHRRRREDTGGVQ